MSSQFDKAFETLGNDPAAYGPRNRLLYWLDKGMVAHLAGKMPESIAAFEQAENLSAQLYTKSASQIASTWIVNDTKEDYRSDEQEYLMVNVFQAFNFAKQGNLEEALVEARRMDDKLKFIGDRYKNPFTYFLSGLLWHVSQESNARQDALIDYQRALELYENPPKVLKDLIASVSTNRDNPRKAKLFVIEYTGLIPIKVADAIPVPLDQTHITQISFPRYVDRHNAVVSSKVRVKSNDIAYVKSTEVVSDLGAMARKILQERKVAMMTKAAVRPMLKYAAEKAIEVPVRDKMGDLAGDIFGILGSIYNVVSEQADLRSWHTLPDEIRLVVFELDAGDYDVDVEDLAASGVLVAKNSLERITLRPGEVKFLIAHR